MDRAETDQLVRRQDVRNEDIARLCRDMRDGLALRLEQVERERDVLITALSERFECPYNPTKGYPCANPNRAKVDDACYQAPGPCWRVWATQEAKK